MHDTHDVDADGDMAGWCDGWWLLGELRKGNFGGKDGSLSTKDGGEVTSSQGNRADIIASPAFVVGVANVTKGRRAGGSAQHIAHLTWT